MVVGGLGGILLDIGKMIAVTFVVLLLGTVVRVVGRGLDGVKLFILPVTF